MLETVDKPRLRAQIVVTLGALRDGRTITTLVGLLADDVPAVRYFAVDGLRALGDPAAAIPLRDFALELAQGLSQRVRNHGDGNSAALLLDLRLLSIAMRALEALDPVIAEPVFSSAVQLPEITLDSAIAVKIAESVYETRRLAVYGLGYTGSPEAEAILLGAEGRGHDDSRIRATAARSLAVLGRPAGAAALVEMLADGSAEVRWTAALGLGRLGAVAAVRALVDRLSDGTARVREEASLSLGYIGDSRARGALARVVEADENAQVRAAAALALDLLDEEGATE
jgi:HEAT repeat protein